jgi:REP element-mobilizing transposase RayT
MPEHVHLLLTPMRDPNGDLFCLADMLKGIKGASAQRVDQVLEAADRCGRKNRLIM